MALINFFDLDNNYKVSVYLVSTLTSVLNCSSANLLPSLSACICMEKQSVCREIHIQILTVRGNFSDVITATCTSYIPWVEFSDS